MARKCLIMQKNRSTRLRSQWSAKSQSRFVFRFDFGGMTTRMARAVRLSTKSIGVITLVAKQGFWLDQRQQGLRLCDVVNLASRDAECQRVAQRIDDHVDFRREPAARATDGLVEIPFLSAPALCWWARTIVASIIAYSLSGSSAKALKRFSQTPLAAHREKRLWVLHQPPKRSGKSRQGDPTRNFQITASTKRRLPSSADRTDAKRIPAVLQTWPRSYRAPLPFEDQISIAQGLLIRLNVLSPMILTKYVARHMMADGAGRIVNISSIVASTGHSGLSVYAASKAAIVGFTRSLAREVGKVGITVNARPASSTPS